jgi:hypothetical protein
VRYEIRFGRAFQVRSKDRRGILVIVSVESIAISLYHRANQLFYHGYSFGKLDGPEVVATRSASADGLIRPNCAGTTAFPPTSPLLGRTLNGG